MIWLLFFTISSQIIWTFFVLNIQFNINDYFLFLLLWFSYLFYMRVIDDYIDRDHDNQFYKERSIQKWTIKLKTLFIYSIIFLSFTSLFFLFNYWIISVLFILLAIVNTYFSIYWYWFWPNFRFKKIIYYHFLNSIWLIMIQFCLYYSLIVDYSNLWTLIFLHFSMIFLNNFLIEVIRKIKSKDEKSNKDDYISILWKVKNFYLIISLLIIIIIINVVIFYIYWKIISYWLLIYILYSILIIFLVYRYYNNPVKIYKNLALLGALLFYIYSNLIYYYL